MINAKGGGYHIIKRSIRIDHKTPKDILKELGITPKMAMVWFLHEKMKFTYMEISSELNISQGCAHKICQRAKLVM